MVSAGSLAWLRPLALVVGFVLIGSASARAWSVTRLDVHARLDNDGRLQVTETLQAKLVKGEESDFRSFGMSVDQSIVLTEVARIDADGTEHKLVDQEVNGPDQFRYYPRGHVYFRYPPLTGDTLVRYRFRYELVNAMSPVWGLGAGPEPLKPDAGFMNPWRRLQTILADAKEAWPEPNKRFRLDHSVLFPDRGVRNDAAFEINYRLEFGTAWREVDPQAELGRVTPAIEYRVRRLFEFLAPGSPPAAANHEAALRLGTIVAVIALGLLFYVAMVIVERLSIRGNGLTPSNIADRLSKLAPEEIGARMQEPTPPISAFGLLGRLASEGKIVIDFDSPTDEEDRTEVHLRLVVPRESLPPLERDFLGEFFEEDETVTTSKRIRQAHRDIEFRPDTSLQALITAAAPTVGSRTTLLTIPLVAVGLWGVFQQLWSAPHPDLLPMIILVNVAALALMLSWPKGWWHGDRSSWGLLVPLVLLAALFAILHIGVNRPFAVEAWIGSAIVILAFHLAQLINSRMPNSGANAIKRDLIQLNRYAAAELRKPSPRLDDRWVPHLMALGLERQIEEWRRTFGESMTGDSSVTGDASSPQRVGAPFTGQLPEPFVGPLDWTDAFFYDANVDDFDLEDDDSNASREK